MGAVDVQGCPHGFIGVGASGLAQDAVSEGARYPTKSVWHYIVAF